MVLVLTRFETQTFERDKTGELIVDLLWYLSLVLRVVYVSRTVKLGHLGETKRSRGNLVGGWGEGDCLPFAHCSSFPTTV